MCVQAMGALCSLVCGTVTGSLAASLSCLNAHQMPQWPQRGRGRGWYRAHWAAWQSSALCLIASDWQTVTVCRMMTYMAATLDIDTKLSSEGRVVIPAAVRRALGVGPGDRVRFVVGQDGEVKLVTAKSLLFAVWANNHGGDGGDSVVDVRRSRQDDVARSSAKWDRVAAVVKADVRSEQEIEESLLAQLGLPL